MVTFFIAFVIQINRIVVDKMVVKEQAQEEDQGNNISSIECLNRK